MYVVISRTTEMVQKYIMNSLIQDKNKIKNIYFLFMFYKKNCQFYAACQINWSQVVYNIFPFSF